MESDTWIGIRQLETKSTRQGTISGPNLFYLGIHMISIFMYTKQF